MKTRLAVIFGGRSGEHDISIRSAKTVLGQLDHTRYDVTPIAIANDGSWRTPLASLAEFPAETQTLFRERYGQPPDRPMTITSDPSVGGLMILEEQSALQIDVVFPVLHGTFGEDGTIQGLLEIADLPYVGCGVLASACGMDKVQMKILFRDAGLPMCRYVWFLRSEWESDANAVLTQIEAKLGFPCFIKPANLGSSVGISKATDRESLSQAIAIAAAYDRKIIAEEGLEMREIECAVLGNDTPDASLPGEYIIHDSGKAFLDYTEKYAGTGNNEFIVPAPVSDELVEKIRKWAVTAFKAIDGSGLARVDFFLRNDTGALLINEINTMPGLTDASGFPKMWAGTGKAFSEVLDELITLAIARHADRKRNRTSL